MEQFFYSECDGVRVLKCAALECAGVRHAFSTRVGGVSEGVFASMNLGLHRGDSEAAVRENYSRFYAANGFAGALHRVTQVHGAKSVLVEAVSEKSSLTADFERAAPEADAQITAAAGEILAVYYADCMPIFLFDPRLRVCAAVHSGWRGTVLKIAGEVCARMAREYGSDPRDIIAAVGPSVSAERYEVSDDVAKLFNDVYGAESGAVSSLFGTPHVNLWECARAALLSRGLAPENILISGICTAGESDQYFSHRVMGAARGNNAAMIEL